MGISFLRIDNLTISFTPFNCWGEGWYPPKQNIATDSVCQVWSVEQHHCRARHRPHWAQAARQFLTNGDLRKLFSSRVNFSPNVIFQIYLRKQFLHYDDFYPYQTWPICVPTFTDRPLITEDMKVEKTTENWIYKNLDYSCSWSNIDPFCFISSLPGWCFWFWSAWDPGYKATLCRDTQQVLNLFVQEGFELSISMCRAPLKVTNQKECK